MKTKSSVVHPAPASSLDAVRHFEARLSFETDCADVHAALASRRRDFVLLDVRAAAFYERGHVPEAVHLPQWEITSARLTDYPPDTVFVIYCAGPHCNGANRAAIRLAKLGRPVKEMIGGITGWVDEGFDLMAGNAPGCLPVSVE